MKRWFVYLLLMVTVLSSCQKDDDQDPQPSAEADAALVYASQSQVWKADIQEVPGGAVAGVVQLTDLGGSNKAITYVSISPDARWAVAAFFDSTASDSRDWTGTLFMYDFKTADLFESLEKTELTALLNFPSEDAAMQFVALGWQNDSVLIAHVRPRTDFLSLSSSNLSFTYSIEQGTVLQLQPSASTQPFAIAIIPNAQKTKFEHELVDGQIVISEQLVAGTPSLTHYDITFR